MASHENAKTDFHLCFPATVSRSWRTVCLFCHSPERFTRILRILPRNGQVSTRHKIHRSWLRLHRRRIVRKTFLGSFRHHNTLLSVWKKWLRENVERFMMSSRCKKLFHSSRVKLPLVHKSVIWFLMSTCLIWILGSKMIPLNNQSNATRRVPDTCLMVGLLPFMIILITASLTSKMFQRDSPWEECAFTRTWSILDKSTCVVVICLGLGVIFGLAAVSRELGTIEFALSCVERKTSITTSHRSRAGKPTIRNPASKDMISDSVELWGADVSCTSNWWRQMFGFRKKHKTPARGWFWILTAPAKSESWKKS